MPKFTNLHNQQEEHSNNVLSDEHLEKNIISKSYTNLLIVSTTNLLNFTIQQFTKFQVGTSNHEAMHREILTALQTLKEGGCTDETFYWILIAAAYTTRMEYYAAFFYQEQNKDNKRDFLKEKFSIKTLHTFLTSEKLNEFLEINNTPLISVKKVEEIIPQQSPTKSIATEDQQTRLRNEILFPLAKKLNECLAQNQRDEFNKWAEIFQTIYTYYINHYTPQDNDCFTKDGKLPSILQKILKEWYAILKKEKEKNVEVTQIPTPPSKSNKSTKRKHKEATSTEESENCVSVKQIKCK